MFDPVDWTTVFVPKVPFLELFVRTTLMYLAIFVLLRFVLKRQAGNVSVTDVLVIVLIADAAQNGMAGDYKSVPGGIVVVGTIVFWSWFLDWLGFYIALIGRLMHPSPVSLVKDGQLNHRNLRSEPITRKELISQLRKQGIEKLEDCKRACMEGDGHISVVKK